MPTHLTYRIDSDRPRLAAAFVASIHQEVASAASSTKGYAEPLTQYWYTDGHAIESRNEPPGFTVTLSDLSGTANASSEAWAHWFAILGPASLRSAAYDERCSATESEDTARAYAELANLRFCILDGRLVQVSRQAERVFGDGWSATFAELPPAQRRIIDRLTKANTCGCAVCERRRLIYSEPDAAADLSKHLARFREGELQSHFHHLHTHPRRWQILFVATRHAKRFMRRAAWTHISLSLLDGRGLAPDAAVFDELVQQLPPALVAGDVDLGSFVEMLEQIAGLRPASIDGVIDALLHAPPPVAGEKPRPRMVFARLVARVAATFPQHATTLEPLLARSASVSESTTPTANGPRLKIDTDEKLRVFVGATELCTTLGAGKPTLVDLPPQSNPGLELSAMTEDGQLVSAWYGENTMLFRPPAIGTLTASILNRRWLTYNFELG